MNLQLNNKLVFISGSSMGIGRAIAEAMLAEGARVIVNGRRDMTNLLAELSRLGTVHGVQGDLSDPAQATKICSDIDAIGDLDVLVNNVGIFNPRPFADIEDIEWQSMFDANIMSTVRLCRHFFPAMLNRDFGRIINISSEAGMRGLESMVHYSMTKGAQIVIGRGLANLTKGSGKDITVNSVLPGPTLTEGVEKWLKESASVEDKTEAQFVSEFFQATEPTSLLQRFIRPEEIANIVTFLASPLASAINGASVRAEGGLIKSIG
ncbi:SDR family NAD(P)-dependent oxidoreductase [Alteromonas aestuariivivens]|uniref:SDR family NAD(P)-dependent oxidoreductase n=1 Tax=Alteromonas aestuariivivens TaxID=1938339 RepID=A0A3D8M4A2_9ALTE|nr:SDR family oxidoreductase [Alteromonas aestuariivivens]RDV24438.1 SDR family NAD(P)-dependent oxidoreductase [Alteromonas aestuariivivens]